MRNKSRFRSSIVAAIAAILVLTGAGAATAIPLSEFTDVGVPEILGDISVGNTLSISLDEPTPTPDFVDVEWTADAVVVRTVHASATDESADLTYTIEPADLGKHIEVHITLSKDGYQNAETDSFATDAVGLGTQSFAPLISGYAASGSTLSVTGLPAGATYTYQWKRNGASISGAKSSTYKQTSSDVGKKISVAVTGKRTGYTNLAKTSASTATVKKGFTAVHAPKITGTAKVGSTLKASTSAWSPAASFKYQWYRDGVAISGATSTSRKVSTADEGTKLTVKVTGSRTGYLTRTYASAATAVVGKGAISAAAPKITGTAKVGATLKVTPAASSPSTAAKTYKWYRSGIEVAGATATTYVLHNVDAHKKITVKVTYAATGYTSKSVTSAATATIATRTATFTNSLSYYENPASGVVYYTDNATDDCVWLRDDDTNADNGFVVEYWGLARWMVEFSPSDAVFFVADCGNWIRFDGTGAQAAEISKDGMYRIGVDIQAGVYQQSGPVDECYVTLEADALNEAGSIVADDSPVLGGTVTIDPATAPYFSTWGCGTWTRIGDIAP